MFIDITGSTGTVYQVDLAQSRDGKTRYSACTCPAGSRQGTAATCKHVSEAWARVESGEVVLPQPKSAPRNPFARLPRIEEDS